MGWFDEQVKQRIKNDDEIFADAFARMVNLVSTKKLVSGFADNRQLVQEAIGDILNYYHVRAQELPEHIEDIDEALEYLLRPSGIMRRNVRLTEGWYRDAAGVMLGTKKDGSIIAILPGRMHGYVYKDPATGKITRIDKKTAEDIDETAVCFYQPLPLRRLKTTDILKYIFGQLRGKDYALMLSAAFAAALLGMAAPYITHYLYGRVVEFGSVVLLAGAILTLFCMTVAGNFVTAVRGVLNAGISAKINLSVQSAMMMRTLSLPPDFFKKFSSGELTNRIDSMNSLCTVIFDAVFSTGATAVFSIVYIGQIFRFAPAVAVPAILVLALTLAIIVAALLLQTSITEKRMTESGRENGVVYALIGGVAKIKNAGAEKRAFAKWSGQYVKAAKYLYQPPLFLTMSGAAVTAVTMFGTIAVYYAALRSGVSVADYMAFDSAYAMVGGAFTALAGIVAAAAQIKPILKMVQPILEAEPEVDINRPVVSGLRGGIELNNVSFRYSDTMPNVLDNLSLKIRPGQYVAVVGKTGCGKSTLMRLLLGFEKPQRGAVYYDGKDIASMDVKSLRRNIGVVMQGGKLFQGDIFSNITISAPQLTLDDAWEAARLAGMEEDIRRMPMGMNTLIAEGQGGISGGQRQRLMIARAIAPKPRILMFDEATSALDNITQKTVSKSLDKLKCTRIVIAHRLSTIRHCDRILVLDQGKIVEDGTYEELLEKKGLFSELVERQRETF